jgi:hypothetical protein
MTNIEWHKRTRQFSRTLFLPLPCELWRPIAGDCCCSYCSADGSPQPAWWDTLAMDVRGDTYPVQVHMPEAHGAKPVRRAA